MKLKKEKRMNFRQLKILELFQRNQGVYFTGQALADEFNVSLRTIRNDIREINEENAQKITSLNKKGYFYKEEKSAENVLIDDSKVRVNNLILLMLSHKTPMSIVELSRYLCVSESSVSSDIKAAKQILKEYSLRIKDVGNKGLIIAGEEINKRVFLTKGDILPYAAHVKESKEFLIDEEKISEIRDVVLNAFVEEKYNVPDLFVRNVLFHIYVNVLRIKKNYLLKHFEVDEKQYEKEIRMARKIYEKLAGKYGIVVNQSEINYLAYILQMRNYDQSLIIEQSTQDLILDILSDIKEKQGIDFTQDENLIMSLVLHYGPLKMRLENDTLLMNPLIDEIRSKNSLAYDLAVLASKSIQQQDHKISEDEIGYLAMHFMIALDKLDSSLDKKSILVICSSTRGNGLLIKHDLSKRFKDTVGIIDVCSASEIGNYDTGQYDAIFTTVSDFNAAPENAIRINYFLTEEDFKKITDGLNEGMRRQVLENLFDEKRYLHIHSGNKEEVIALLCENNREYGYADDHLYASVMEREQMGFTEIGTLVAIPHPSELFDNPSCISVGILDKPITWVNKKVQIVFLLNVQKGMRKQLKEIFALIAEVASDEKKVRKLIGSKNYAEFIGIMKEYMKEMSYEQY